MPITRLDNTEQIFQFFFEQFGQVLQHIVAAYN